MNNFSVSKSIQKLAGPVQHIHASRQMVDPLIDQSIALLGNELANICYYHLGATDTKASLGGTTFDGKALRPALVTVGTSLEANTSSCHENLAKASAAVELIHQWSLLEDDIIDDDELRRGRPSTWKTFGVPRTILAGDALQAQALKLVLDIDDGNTREHMERILTAVQRLVWGQAAEQTLVNQVQFASSSDYTEVATAKTGALLGCCVALGVRLQGGDRTQADNAARAGELLGVAWQASNDLEDIWATTGTTGKASRNDSRQGKATLPVIFGAKEANRHSANSSDAEQFGKEASQWSASPIVRKKVEEYSDACLQSSLEVMRKIGLSSKQQEDFESLFNHVIQHSRNKLSELPE